MSTSRTRPILIVDDDPDAVALTKHALAKAGIKTQIDVMDDGAQAIAYLKQKLAEGEHALPLLLFLDLKMPGTDGFQVLDWIRQQPRLRKLLTVVLSSSTNTRDVDKAYALGAKTYFGKYPVASDVRTVFQLANAMLTVDEIEKFVLPGIRPAETPTNSGAGITT
ncbi:MAG TPA: response regulator [Opitutaceae bacterium]|nr:response regulator [Opitutaceae bacterium]